MNLKLNFVLINRIWLAVFLLWGLGQAQLVSGPMVGHTTDSSAQVWVLAGEGDNVEIAYGLPDGSDITTLPMPQDPDKNFRSLVELTGFEPLTEYRYQININNNLAAEGSFTTAPMPNQPAQFKYIPVSCIDLSEQPVQSAWDEVLNQEPDFNLMMGDIVYANTTNYDGLWEYHINQREVPNYAEVLATAPAYAVWDDHDYGPNNSHGGTSGKENSLRAFKDIWANPSYGTPELPSIYSTFYWGNVQFFLVDGRYYRTDEDAPNSNSKTQFGEAQRQLLYKDLEESKAVFKILVSGFDWMSGPYSNEAGIMGREFGERNIYGLFFHSGDIHRNDYKQQDKGMGYPMTQVTSSGIAKRPDRPWAVIDVNTTLDDPEIRTTFYHDDAPAATRDGEQNIVLKLSDLTPPGVSDIVLNSPVGGESIHVSTTHEVTWTRVGNGIDNVDIEYNTGGSWQSIATSVTNSGSYDWQVPSEPSGTVKVRVSNADGSQAGESREFFAIVDPNTIIVPDRQKRSLFGNGGTFSLTLPYQDKITRGHVHDYRGQLIQTVTAEGNILTWDGKDASGLVAPGGMYLLRVLSGDVAGGTYRLIKL